MGWGHAERGPWEGDAAWKDAKSNVDTTKQHV